MVEAKQNAAGVSIVIVSHQDYSANIGPEVYERARREPFKAKVFYNLIF